MSLVAIIISLMANVISFYSVHDSYKRSQRLRKELDEKDEIMRMKDGMLKILASPNDVYSSKGSKNSDQHFVSRTFSG
ncbi:hypothetical protein ME1_00782 [Bartonella vinsonii subsp. arupensis OK-94-513]|uniref:Uncharacterized protein n=1 Tax=Bartonella vinsonii subsp. arupensis OK-94-513 TaxID=1094562 RepID=J0QYP6_BARVI|nr:hypothetical protein [Bartonella vinsonii]EJF88324.1 hypothetical protein ME1_00782 [Bartonella vinsonii subsp. arupensis OK-94-513]